MSGKWAAVYRMAVGIVSLAAGYGGAVVVQWVARNYLLRDAGWGQVWRQNVAGNFGHYLVAITVAFGLCALLVEPGRVVQSRWKVALGAGAATGVCMAGGVAVLFGVLLSGRGVGEFVALVLLFGGVAGVLTVAVFRVLARGGQSSKPDAALRGGAVRRLGVAVGALAASGGLGCGLLLVVSVLFGRQHSPGWWLPLYRFLLTFLLSGWLVFGLPILVLGPARGRFRKPGPSAIAGGAAAVVFLECYFQTMFVGGGGVSLAGAAFHGCFGALAFLLGALTTYLYVMWAIRE